MTAFDFTEGGLAAALRALGDTPNAVADKLLAGGHYGRPDDDCNCPVAEYLESVYPGLFTSVTDQPPDGLVAEVHEGGLDYRGVLVSLPKPVAEFVRAFDAGEYPELDRTRAVTAP